MQRNRKISLYALSLILAFILFGAVSQSEFNPDITPSHIGIFDSESPANIITRFPIAYWQMNEAGGVDVFDSTLPQVNGHTLGGSMWTSGIVGTCLELLAGQYIEIIDPSSYLNLPEIFTIEAWVNLQNTVGHHTIIVRSNSPSITQYHFAVQDGQLFFEQQLGTSKQVLSSPTFTVTPNQWHHVAVVFRRSASRVWFYIDGQEDSQTFPAEFVSNPGQVFIGQDLFDPDPGPLIGLIDEVAIYDYTLDLIMIQDHYAKGLIGLGYLDEINSPPVAEDDYYTADEDTPLTVSQPGVLANDYDAEGDPLEAVLETGPSFGTLTLLPDGSFNYIPYPDTAGMDSFTYKAIDAEDVSNIATVTIDVIPDDDRTGPVISIAYTGDSTDANPGTWDVLVYDPESGIQSVLVEVDGISVGTAPGIYSVPGTAGDHTITVTSANADFDTGPQDQETSTLSDTVTIIDVTPPETTITLSGTLGANNWYVSDVTVTLTVNEAATTAYQVNDGPWMMYSGPFIVELEGNVIISFNSTDTAGNREDTKTRQYRVDKTPPAIKLDIEPVPGVGLLVTLTATETGSGLIDMGYNLDGGRWIRYGGPVLLDQEGIVTFNCRAQDLAGNLVMQEEIIDVVIPPEILPPELVYTGDLTGTYSDPAYLEAKLTDTLTGLPIEGRLLVFTLGPLTFDAVTDASGIASYVLLLDLPSDTYSLTISFAGDDSYTETSVTHDFFVAKEYAHADYTGRTVLPTSDDSFTLMATIFDDADGYWGNLTHIYVTFLVYFDSELVLEIGPVMVETTGVEGVGIAIAVTENLDEGDYIVVIHFESLDNSYYCGPDTEAGVTIYVPEREFVHGAGFIRDEDGHRVFFVFHAKYSCKGRLKGFLLLTYLEDDWVYVIQSTEILGLNVDGNHGIIEGSVRIAKFNLKTFEKDCSREEFSFRIDAWDNKNSDEYEDDVFQIRIHNSVGLVKYEVGFEPLGLLVRGNIKVKEHPHRHK